MSHDLEATHRLQDAEPGAAEALAVTPNADLVKVPFIFTGKGSEYFRIWIVNLLLTIVTLGVYSAWAKVRNKQYFYGNTSLDDATFNYHADPKKILYGRLIAGAFLLAYVAADFFSLMLSSIMLGVFFLVLPWVICKALRFNAINSSYRNVRFNFHGTMADSYKAFLFWPALGVITLGLMMPYAIYKQQCFVARNHSYGNARFDFNPQSGDYYIIYLALGGIMALGLVAAFVAGLLGALIGSDTLMALLTPLVMMGVYLLVFGSHQAMMANVRYQNLGMGQHRTDSDWGKLDYTWLMFTNGLGIVFTLGLLIPWAKVRTARYKSLHTWCLVAGNLDGVVALEQAQGGSVGEGMSDFFGIDVGI